MALTRTPIDVMRTRVECDHKGDETQNGNMMRCTACGCTWYVDTNPPPHAKVEINVGG